MLDFVHCLNKICSISAVGVTKQKETFHFYFLATIFVVIPPFREYMIVDHLCALADSGWIFVEVGFGFLCNKIFTLWLVRCPIQPPRWNSYIGPSGDLSGICVCFLLFSHHCVTFYYIYIQVALTNYSLRLPLNKVNISDLFQVLLNLNLESMYVGTSSFAQDVSQSHCSTSESPSALKFGWKRKRTRSSNTEPGQGKAAFAPDQQVEQYAPAFACFPFAFDK